LPSGVFGTRPRLARNQKIRDFFMRKGRAIDLGERKDNLKEGRENSAVKLGDENTECFSRS